MSYLHRISENPIILPNIDKPSESQATFNPCVVKNNGVFHMVYRAISSEFVSSIAYAKSNDGIHFESGRPLILGKEPWEKFGCEDPRITFFDNKYYIFYTALSTYPFSAPGIKVGLAITKDFQTIEEKHPVTPFNAKAMALFPEKINNKIVAILTTNTDIPPAKIALAYFDKEEDIWSDKYWNNWYASLDKNVIPLLRSMNDHLEVGAPPIKTEMGWLLVYSYIQNYFTKEKLFIIEALLLDLKDPSKILGRTKQPLLVPEKEYEFHGMISDIIFPSGALIEDELLYVYYGAADTTCCLAIGNLKELLDSLIFKEKRPNWLISKCTRQGFERYIDNPIISPRPEFFWEAQATFNPAAIYEDGRFHIVYRAMGRDNVSVFGYASSKDGIHIDERIITPIYTPRANFEKNFHFGNSGCEDPRITKIDDTLYMFYTAYDGFLPRVAYTSIKIDDFINKQWHWEYPKVITPPNIDDKDACLLPKKIGGKFVIFHRIGSCICINLENDLDFHENKWLVHGGSLIKPRKDYWDNRKFGISAPPIETKYGWLLFYHRVSVPGNIYKIEASLLKLEDPTSVITHTDAALLEPEMDYEKIGLVDNVVFPCSAVLLNEEIYTFYGGGDRVIGVARISLEKILKRLGV